jgi:hypothetical protein
MISHEIRGGIREFIIGENFAKNKHFFEPFYNWLIMKNFQINEVTFSLGSIKKITWLFFSFKKI